MLLFVFKNRDFSGDRVSPTKQLEVYLINDYLRFNYIKHCYSFKLIW